jgi:hypothetical protein
MERICWLVESHYNDDGHVEARCEGTAMAAMRPSNEKVSTSSVDIYRDWFSSRAAADWLLEAVRDFEAVSLRRSA